jgi:hypothetical protein
LSQADKDRAGELAVLYGDASTWLGNISFGLSFVPGQQPGSIAFGTFGIGFYVASVYQQRQHDDPWDSDYQSPYDGAYFDQSSLGLSCDGIGDLGDNFVFNCQDFVNQMVNIAFYGDFAYVSLNRSNSCVAAGAGCQDWQKARAMYGLHHMGNAFANAAGDMWVMRYILLDKGYNGADIDTDLSNFTSYIAGLLGDAASFWQGVQ